MISIIVPVYNAQKYIDECIQSLLSQYYTDIEIILVDDGSTDDSVVICNKYRKLDSRIKLISQSNGGVSSARNKGIEAANGEWIMFVDSDDFLEKDALIKILNANSEKNSDIIIFNYFKVTDTYKEKGDPVVVGFQTKNEFIENCENNLNTVHYNKIYNKLYKTNLIKNNNICFPDGINMGEDFRFNLLYFTYCDTFLSIDDYLYNYRIDNTQSLMHTIPLSYENICDEIKCVYDFFVKNSINAEQYHSGLDRYILDKVNVFVSYISKQRKAKDRDLIKIMSNIKQYYKISDYSKFKYKFLLKLAWEIESGKLLKVRYKMILMRYNIIMKVKGNKL